LYDVSRTCDFQIYFTIGGMNGDTFDMLTIYFEYYFHNLDIDTVDTKHYMYTRNLMIDKGLLEGARGQLTAIDDMLEEFNNYKEIA
jgi:hypothetical protein